MKTTKLHLTPFAILNVTTRDDRRRIVEVAEEKSLELDNEICQKARSDLTNPRTRLSAEISWLPGVSPRKACQLIENLLDNPMAVREESGLPTLAHLNLLAAAFEAVDDRHDADDLASFIQEVADLVDKIDPQDVLRDINEDRAISGFPEVRVLEQVEAEISDRKRYYRSAIKDALDKLPPKILVQVITQTVEVATFGGEDHAPELIDDLVDSYELETQGFLQKEAENIHKLVKAARDAASSGEAAVKPYVDKLDVVARNWDTVAQPIQLSAKARGIDHEASRDLAYEIRSLAIDLFNQHNMLVQSQRITSLLKELFIELPDVFERVEKDAETLSEISEERNNSFEREKEWAQDITYQAEIGLIFKDILSISPEGLRWKRQHFSLESVTQVRWGGVRKSVNGIPTGTTFTIGFGNGNDEAVVELKNQDVYSCFIEKLWMAVCVRLLGEILMDLKAGQGKYFGNALIHDEGITLEKYKLLGRNERMQFNWDSVELWNADGSLCISSKKDRKFNTAISYLQVPNTHILEHILRIAFKKPGLRRLSDFLWF